MTEVPLADDSERRLVLDDWNATAVEYPQDRTIHGLIAEQAARTPDAVAVVDAGRTLTYAELNAQADRLAEHLAATGVRSGAIVGLCVERSAEMTVGLLGILKAGAARRVA